MSEPQTTPSPATDAPERLDAKQASKNAQRINCPSPERESDEDDEITSCYVRGYN